MRLFNGSFNLKTNEENDGINSSSKENLLNSIKLENLERVFKNTYTFYLTVISYLFGKNLERVFKSTYTFYLTVISYLFGKPKGENAQVIYLEMKYSDLSC